MPGVTASKCLGPISHVHVLMVEAPEAYFQKNKVLQVQASLQSLSCLAVPSFMKCNG